MTPEQIQELQEREYQKMISECDEYLHPESFRWGFEKGFEAAESCLSSDMRLINLDQIVLPPKNIKC